MKQVPSSNRLLTSLLACLFLIGIGCHGPNNFDVNSGTDLSGGDQTGDTGGSDGGDGTGSDGTVADCVDITLSTAFTAISLAFGIGPTLIEDIPNDMIFKTIFESIQAKSDSEECPEGEVPDPEGSFATSTIPGETGQCESLVDQIDIGLVTEDYEFSLECNEYGVPLTDPLVTMDGLLGFTLVRIAPILDGSHLEFHLTSQDLSIDCTDGVCPVTINFQVVVETIGPQLFVWIDGCMTICDDVFKIFGLQEIELAPS